MYCLTSGTRFLICKLRAAGRGNFVDDLALKCFFYDTVVEEASGVWARESKKQKKILLVRVPGFISFHYLPPLVLGSSFSFSLHLEWRHHYFLPHLLEILRVTPSLQTQMLVEAAKGKGCFMSPGFPHPSARSDASGGGILTLLGSGFPTNKRQIGTAMTSSPGALQRVGL